MKRAMPLCETAKQRIDLKKGFLAAEYEMRRLFTDYEYKMAQLDEITSLCKKTPESEHMLAIKEIGVFIVA